MILPNKLDKIILLCVKELFLNCIEPVDLSEKTFLEVIDYKNSITNNCYIKKSDYNSIYSKWINSDEMNLLQRDTFYININRYSPKTVKDDFILPIND